MKVLWQKWSKPVYPEKISLFRILFGLVLFMQVFYFQYSNFIQKDVLDPVLHFSYPYLDFIDVMDPWLMKSIVLILFLSSLMLIIGFKARFFSFIYLIFFTYLWLIDKGYYNNHYYLISLILLLLCFINSDRSLSILSNNKGMNAAWEEYILLFQFSIVLLFAGFNKINEWWLIHHEPMHHILMAKANESGNLFWENAIIEFILVWGGLFFDLLIVPFLLWKKTRRIAMVFFFCFNMINLILFYKIGEIGIFPFLMMSSLILFSSTHSIRNFLNTRFSYSLKEDRAQSKIKALSPVFKSGIIIYMLFQLLFPLRHHLYSGNVDFTGEGQRFSWRMKSVYKDFKIAFLLVDEESGISASLDPRQILTVKQYTNLGYYPELIIPVADNLRKAALLKGIKKPKIYVDYQVGFMALAFQYIVDPKQELSGLKYSPFRHSDWILPISKD